MIYFFTNFELYFLDSQVCQHFVVNKYNKCKLKSHNQNYFIKEMCVCKGNINLIWSNSTLQTLSKLKTSPYSYFYFKIYFKNKKPFIIDKNFKFYNQKFFNISIFGKYISYEVNFQNVKGFDVNLFNENFNQNFAAITFYFYDLSFAFFSNGRILKTCKNFPLQTKSFFQVFKGSNIYQSHVKFKPVCPLAFVNINIQSLRLSYLINTFYKTNIPIFLDLPKEINEINSNIESIEIFGYGGISLNSRIINRHIFNLTSMFTFYSEITSIENGLFKPLKNTRYIQFISKYWRKLFHKGIHWIYDLNSHIRVNIDDSEMIKKHFNEGTNVNIISSLTPNDYVERFFPNFLPDEDFCIYVKFPFEQMIVVYIDIPSTYNMTSCTFAWLTHPKQFSYFSMYNKENLKLYIEIFEKCDFNQK